MTRPEAQDAAGPGGVRRRPAVAGSFYPASAPALAALVQELLGATEPVPRAEPSPGEPPAGLLVPHAGLAYSGATAAAAWRLLAGHERLTVVVLGTNHSAWWLSGVGAWPDGAWETPLGDVPVDADLADAVLGLGQPFDVDRETHVSEHSIEVQLPILQAIVPDARIVPLAVAAGRGRTAAEAGRRLGELLLARRSAGAPITLAVSTDMAHYPDEAGAEAVTEALLPSLRAVDAAELAAREAAVVGMGIAGLTCGMCGIEPAVVGLAALRAMGATRVTTLAAATSADAGAGADRVVGYLALRFDR